MEKLVNLLKNKKQTISTMESCTGGMLASEITNIDGASNVFKVGLVTYSNEFKEYFGVSEETINEYTVYSNEVSKEMAKKVSEISGADYSVGITGMLGKQENINTVYISIYNKKDNKYYDYNIIANGNSRIDKKKYVINFVKEKLYGICK